MALVENHNSTGRYFRAVRPVNLLIILLTVCLSAGLIAVTGELHLQWSDYAQVFLVIITSVSLAAAGNLHNDLRDAITDTVNKKPSELSAIELKKTRNILGAGGLLIGIGTALWLLSMIMFAITCVIVLLLWIYSPRLKRLGLPGNLVIASMPLLAVVFLPLIWWESDKFLNEAGFQAFGFILFFAFFAFLTNLARELIKDIEDLEGDRVAGYSSFPLRRGIRRTMAVINLVILVLNITIIGFAIHLFSQSYHISATYMTVPVALSVTWAMRNRRSSDPRELGKQSRQMKFIMLAGMMGMLIIIFEHLLCC